MAIGGLGFDVHVAVDLALAADVLPNATSPCGDLYAGRVSALWWAEMPA
jgi:hypothetical protein